MHVTLLVPGLFWPRETADAVLNGLDVPALAQLLSRARRQALTEVSLVPWLCASHGVARQQDWPIAPLTLALDGVEAGDAYWLRADPVHIRVERNGLTFVGTALLALSAEESQALASAITAHFAPVGLAFHAPARERWYVKLASAPDLVTRPPEEVVGADVQTSLPTGRDALRWHGVFNEVQMLLHAHPVNAVREECGSPPVNSIWIWGGGMRPHAALRPFTQVWSDNAEAAAIAQASGERSAALPDSAEAVLAAECESDGEHLIVLDHLAAPSAYHDADVWRARLSRLESTWFAPLAAALRSARLKRVTIVVPGADAGSRFDIARSDLMKFWRSRKPLSQLA
jgi:hypothetical protein